MESLPEGNKTAFRRCFNEVQLAERQSFSIRPCAGALTPSPLAPCALEVGALGFRTGQEEAAPTDGGSFEHHNKE